MSAYIDAHAEEVDENGHRLVARNGHHNEREVITAAGPVPVRGMDGRRPPPAVVAGALRRSTASPRVGALRAP